MTDSPVARPRTPATIVERSRDQPAGDRTDLLGPIDDDRLTAFLQRPSAHPYRRHGRSQPLPLHRRCPPHS